MVAVANVFHTVLYFSVYTKGSQATEFFNCVSATLFGHQEKLVDDCCFGTEKALLQAVQ